MKSIELDCAPGGIRPGDLLPVVIRDTGLEAKEPVSRFFGNWQWDYSDTPDEVWREAQPVIKERILGLHKKGYIRYGSW
jgi:hypothetical protein